MIRVIKKINKLLTHEQKIRVVVLALIMLIGAIFEVLGVSIMLPLVTAIMDSDFYKNNPLAAATARVFGVADSKQFIFLCIIFLILIFVVKDLYIIFETYLQNRFVYNNQYYTQNRVLSAYLSRPYEFFLHLSSGEVIRVVQTDIPFVFVMLNMLLSFAAESVVSLALLVTVFVINPFITCIVVIAMILMVLVIVLVVKPKAEEAGHSFEEHSALVNKWVLQAIHGIKEIKVANNADFFKNNFNRSAQQSIKSMKWSSVWSNTPRLMIEMTTVISALVAIAIQIAQGVDTSHLISSLSAFIMAAVRLMPAANRVIYTVTGITYHEPSLDSTIKALNSLENIQFVCDGNERKEEIDSGRLSLKKQIELNDISFTYSGSVGSVLNHANMVIPIGKSVGIVGTSGSGKTTTVDILLGLLNPQEGEVYSDGENIMTNYNDWLSHFSYIPQSVFMLDDSIRNNIVFGRGNMFGSEECSQLDERVIKALKEASLYDFVVSLPDGLDTQIGERGVRLSGGQRQRIGIARAMFLDPDILVFDEATSALDNETEREIMESINALHGKKTLIIIAHRLSTIAGCDIVYRVENGKITRE